MYGPAMTISVQVSGSFYLILVKRIELFLMATFFVSARARWARPKLDGHRQNGGHQKRGAVQELLFQLQETSQLGQPAPAA